MKTVNMSDVQYAAYMSIVEKSREFVEWVDRTGFDKTGWTLTQCNAWWDTVEPVASAAHVMAREDNYGEDKGYIIARRLPGNVQVYWGAGRIGWTEDSRKAGRYSSRGIAKGVITRACNKWVKDWDALKERGQARKGSDYINRWADAYVVRP